MKQEPRHLIWFSCGAASAVAAYVALKKWPDAEVLYCDTLKYEHPDNVRFMADVSRWIGKEIKILRNPKYTNIMDVYRKRRFIAGIHGALCTVLLKKDVRIAYSKPTDIHIFGFTIDEQKRIDRFEADNHQLWCEWPLRDKGFTKKDCYTILEYEGIEIPAMYRLGYRNNNCIGCVKGGLGYWNKIRRDFPERFAEMAQLEKEIGGKILKLRDGGKTRRIWLTELPEGIGRYDEEDIECGVLCEVRK